MSWLALLPKALQLLTRVVSWAQAERERGAGRAEAMSAGLDKALASIRTARAVEAEAEAAHRADPSDGAFDPEFQRRD